jgi:hypothetical protein
VRYGLSPYIKQIRFVFKGLIRQCSFGFRVPASVPQIGHMWRHPKNFKYKVRIICQKN